MAALALGIVGAGIGAALGNRNKDLRGDLQGISCLNSELIGV